MQKPTYKYICSSNQDVLQIDVFLSKKKTGTIKKFEDGWCYFPKRSKLRGDVFKTYDLVMKSLEEE